MEIDYETTIPEDNQSETSHEIIQYGGSVPTDAELQVIHQVMKEATESAKKEEEGPSLAEQLVAAKNDPHRISQAVESIGGNVVEVSPGPEAGMIDTSLADDSVASRLSRRLLGTPLTTPVVTTTKKSPRRLAVELAQSVVAEQIEQSVVTEQVPIEGEQVRMVLLNSTSQHRYTTQC